MPAPALADPPCKPKTYKVQDIASMAQVSARQVWRWRDLGILPGPMKLGSVVRWNAEVIDDWFRRGCPDCRKRR
jgi:predicted DNA-binding transcriptional regulator AlpA